MKKLIIAAAIVCAAAMSQAASFKWMASGVNGYESSTPYTGSATLYAYLSTASASTATAVKTTDMGDGSITLTFTDDNLESGKTYKFYYTMTDDNDNVFTSSTLTRAAQKSGTAQLGFSSNGTWAGAPEPTSAMLLLLGVAGLALKRKQK